MKLSHLLLSCILGFIVCVSHAQQAEGLDSEMTSRGRASGVIATILIDKAVAQKLIPDGMILDSFPGLPETLHPVTIFIGQHRNLTSTLEGSDLLLADKYNEITYGVLFVREKGMTQSYTHLSALKLDDNAAILVGLLAGFPKKTAEFRTYKNFKGGRTRIYAENKKLVFESIFERPRTYNKTQFEQNFAIIKATQSALIVRKSGQTKCLGFNWGFDIKKARPVNASLNFKPLFDEAVAQGSFQSLGLDQSLLGAFEFEADWTMAAPQDCK